MSDTDNFGINAQVKSLFEERKHRQQENIALAKRVVAINQYLQQFDWVFLHPYLVGHNIETFERMQKEGTGSKDEVLKIFADYFFDLHYTAYMIDGYFKERPFMAPYCHLIDQAVVLCLQKDYCGAINLLIPVIEGCLREYLVVEKGKKVEKTLRKEHLLQTFTFLKMGYLNIMEKHLASNQAPSTWNVRFNANQLKQLLKNEQEYINLWFSIIEDYFAHNLYLDTRSDQVDDKLNRHAILHALTKDVYYNLENFLRLFNCLYFMSWAFGMGCEGIKMLPDLDEKLTYNKWKAFEKIKRVAALTVDIKAELFSSHAGFDSRKYKSSGHQSKMDIILDHSFSLGIEMDLKNIDDLFKKYESKK
jgi:hypothetical protein